MEPTYKLEDLAKLAGVSPRTVRYYVQRGLLPAPTFRGKDTAYDDDHLKRLQAIRRLQDRHMPLDEIQAELQQRGPEAILSGTVGASAPLPVPPVPLPPPGVGRAAETWRRYPLQDGVEIHIRDDVAPSVGHLIADLANLIAKKGPYRW